MDLVSWHLEGVDYAAWLEGSAESAAVSVPLVLEAVEPESVVDVGCGLGHWLAVVKEHGVEDVRGYDGPWVDRSHLLIAPPEFAVADLNRPLSVERRFDLALCLEVAQILGPERAESLVDALVALSDVVVFSAAVPGQGGILHENEQWPFYWAELFAAHGYAASDPFRFKLWERDEVRWWFRQNMVCYCTLEALERRPALAEARCTGAPLALVHPGCLEQARSDAAEPQRARRHWPALRR
jgi:hypothetical protein